MKGALARAIRREARAAERDAVDKVFPGLEALDQNEKTTRERVDKLEARASGNDTVLAGHALRLNQHGALLHRGLWGRLLWLLRGY